MPGAKWRHTGFSWFSFCLSDPCLGFAGRLRTENMLFGKCPRGRLRPNRTREGVPRTAAYFLFGLSCWRGHSPNRIPEASRRRSPNSSIFSVRAQLLERALPEQDPRSEPKAFPEQQLIVIGFSLVFINFLLFFISCQLFSNIFIDFFNIFNLYSLIFHSFSLIFIDFH